MSAKPSEAPGALPELDFGPGSLAIADLHLDLCDRAACASFAAFVARQPPARLIVLGDLFEYWIGPAQLAEPGAAAVLGALRDYRARGGALELLHGNRDFLLDERFERASGARLHPRGLVLRVARDLRLVACSSAAPSAEDRAGELPAAERVLLLHGDELCTLDHAYQRYKRVVRSRPLRAFARCLPAALARAIAARLRAHSRGAVAAKAPLAVEQRGDAAEQWLARTGCALLVVGHAHRFRRERVPSGAWVVLDAFGAGAHDALGAFTGSRRAAAPGSAS